RSGLMRNKWDEKHGATTYGERTIEKALSGRTDHYRGEQITQEVNEHPDFSVNVNQPRGEEQESGTEQNRAIFPQESWQGVFQIWRDICCPATEAPEEFLWAACLITIGLVLGRSVVLKNPRSLFPNSYVVLLGQTGDDRKSTVLDFSLEALFHVGLKD